MTPLAPTLVTGSADLFAVAPALPAGIALDATTGVIAGVPVSAVAADTYTITASNAAGSATHSLDLEVIDPPLPIVSFALAASSAGESAATASVAVTLSGASATDVTIDWILSGSAVAGADFVEPASPLVIAAGQTGASIDIALLDDPTDEPDETLSISFGAPAGALVGVPSVHTLTLVDDDPSPQVRFASPALSLPETPGTTTIDVLLDRDSTATIEVSYSVGGTALPGVDFLLTPAILDLAPGTTAATLELQVLGDTVFEGDESIAIELLPGAGAVAGTPEILAITIGEDDPPPVVEIQGGGTAVEGAGPAALTVALSSLSAVDAVVSFSLGGSATPGTDYLAPTGPIVLPAGTLSTDIAIDPLADAEIEGPETAEVTLLGATGAALGLSVVASVTIEDASIALPEVTISGGGTVVESGAPIVLVASLSAVSSSRVTIPFTLAGSAMSGVDYATPASPVAIAAGSLATTITIDPVDDGVPEGPESVIVTLLPPTGATLGSPASAVVTIDEGPPPPEVTIGAGGSVLESGSPIEVWVSLSAAAAAPVEVVYSLGGSATAGVDYLASPNPITIPAGDTAAAIQVEPIPDGIAEGIETIVVDLVGATGAILGAAVAATITIDESALPVASLSGGGASGVEGAGPVFLTVSLSAPSLVNVQVQFDYSGSATPLVDYLSVPSPQTILAGALSTSIGIDPLADGVVEPDETVTVTLTGAIGATLGATTVRTVTIEDGTSATAPPSGLDYAEPAAVYAVGVAIAANLPSLAGGSATSWSVVPPLPAGLALDPASGAIDGSPEEVQLATPYQVTAGNALGTTSATITIEVRASFAFAISSPVVPYSPATGDASFSISLTVGEELGTSPVAPHGIQSFSGGILLDPAKVSLLSVAEGAGVALVNGGQGPDFFFPFPATGGLTFGVQISPSLSLALLAPGPVEWATVGLATVPAWLAGDPDGEVLAIEWSGSLGSPPVPCEISYENQFTHPPDLIPGTISFQP